jgi:hypothetical protein
MDEKERVIENVMKLLDKLPEDEQRRILAKYVGGERHD